MKKNVWIAGMTAILSAGLVWLAPVFTLADERIPDGVSVGAVSLSGLTEEEAEKQIESYVNEKLNQDITLVVNGTEAKSDAQTLGVAWDNQDEVAEAIQGTELKGNLVKRYMKKKLDRFLIRQDVPQLAVKGKTEFQERGQLGSVEVLGPLLIALERPHI